MNKKLLQRGFTLIELLVVIAIIGILAAVVIGSLNDARSGGQDASIKQSVASVRSQAEVFFNADNYTYEGVCADPDIVTLMEAAADGSNPANTYAADDTIASSATVSACHDAADAYAASAPLVVGEYWCVDNTGTSKQTVNPLGPDEVVCPAS